MLIKIINVDIEPRSAANGRAYEMAEVLFEAEGKKNTKNIASFSNPSVFKTIKESKKGDSFQVETIKDDKGYWQWKAISSADSGEVKQPEYAQKNTTVNTTVNRSFETKEERDARQRLIVRQSSLTNSVAILSPGAKAALDPKVVKALADELTDWVFEKVDIFDQPNDLPE